MIAPLGPTVRQELVNYHVPVAQASNTELGDGKFFVGSTYSVVAQACAASGREGFWPLIVLRSS